MYFSIVFVIFALLLFFVLSSCRRRWAIKKVYSMCCAEKCRLLNTLIEPFGYCYIECQDIISSRNDAWQRSMGYTSLFDHAASHFNMVFDCLPVYFNYRNRTWLIEFWKGQYGINTGAEIGIYYADRIVPEKEIPFTLFQAVEDKDMLPFSFELLRHKPLACVSRKAWWLTAFCMVRFSRPEQLCMNISIAFFDCEMRCLFLQALQQAGLSRDCLKVCGNTVHIQYCDSPKEHCGFFARLVRSLSQFSNRIFCRLYLLITRPFTTTLDRLLYLYYLLPFAFRRTLTPRRYRRGQWHHLN